MHSVCLSRLYLNDKGRDKVRCHLSIQETFRPLRETDFMAFCAARDGPRDTADLQLDVFCWFCVYWDSVAPEKPLSPLAHTPKAPKIVVLVVLKIKF